MFLVKAEGERKAVKVEAADCGAFNHQRADAKRRGPDDLRKIGPIIARLPDLIYKDLLFSDHHRSDGAAQQRDWKAESGDQRLDAFAQAHPRADVRRVVIDQAK